MAPFRKLRCQEPGDPPPNLDCKICEGAGLVLVDCPDGDEGCCVAHYDPCPNGCPHYEGPFVLLPGTPIGMTLAVEELKK